jgi:hypothetical protein
MDIALVCPIRNEGPFLVDWVVWHRMLGFGPIVVASNDCTDHSDALLDALHAAGWIHHLRCVIPRGQPIYHSKMRAVMELKIVRRAEWAMVMDADEYLVIHRGTGKLADLIAPGADFKAMGWLAMAINWQIFGSYGIDQFADIPVHRQFFAASPRREFKNRTVKTLHARPRWFANLGDHGPVRLKLARAEADTGVTWGTRPLVWINAAGKVLDYWTPTGPYRRWLAAADQDYTVAQINHYMLRSAETFGLKKGTMSPSANKDRYTDDYQARANAPGIIDLSALRHEDAFTRGRAAAMALPGVAALHYRCCADHVRLIAEKAGGRAGDDPRHAAFLAQAAAHQ